MASLSELKRNFEIFIGGTILSVFAIAFIKVRRLAIAFESVKRNSLSTIFISILLLASLISVLQLVPVWQVSRFGINDTTVIAQLENNYRATLAQIIGGSTLLLGLYFTWKNVVTAKENQITERFTKAIEHLGSQNLEIKLGGVYALERVSIQSKNDHYLIMEILTAYIRKNSPVESENIIVEDTKNQKVTLDTQAMLTIIGRRKYAFRKGEQHSLDLSKTILRGANLSMANHQWINFNRADLEGAFFEVSDLNHAYLRKANLKETTFRYSNLEWAELNEANLENAYFNESNLKWANFKGTNLKGTEFVRTNLKGAFNLSSEQLSLVKTLYKTKLNKKLYKQLKEKHPNLFEKPEDEI